MQDGLEQYGPIEPVVQHNIACLSPAVRREGINPDAYDEVRIASPAARKPDERQGARETIALNPYEHAGAAKGCGKPVCRVHIAAVAAFAGIQALEMAGDHAHRDDANHERRHELSQNNLNHEHQRSFRWVGHGYSIGGRSDDWSRMSGHLPLVSGFQHAGSYQSLDLIRRDRGIARTFDCLPERGLKVSRQREIAIPCKIEEDGPALHHAVVYA
jgi:hypothetical protein